MSLTPAQDRIEAERKKQKVELCGKNMGPHQYIPIAWGHNDQRKWVTRLLCRICFTNVQVETLIANYPEATLL